MRILGIDPGYAIMGYGILDYNGNRFRTVDYGSIETEAHTPMPQRLNQLFDRLNEVIQKYQPEEASIEELFFNSNTTTAIKVGEARGVALLACERNGLRVSEYTPLQIKVILNLKEVPKPDDTADAVAAAICHAHSRNNRVIG